MNLTNEQHNNNWKTRIGCKICKWFNNLLNVKDNGCAVIDFAMTLCYPHAVNSFLPSDFTEKRCAVI